MNGKDKTNRISGILLLAIIVVVTLEFVIGNNSDATQISLYAIFPLFLIWFGTRRNKCGSCNQIFDESVS